MKKRNARYGEKMQLNFNNESNNKLKLIHKKYKNYENLIERQFVHIHIEFCVLNVVTMCAATLFIKINAKQRIHCIANE